LKRGGEEAGSEKRGRREGEERREGDSKEEAQELSGLEKVFVIFAHGGKKTENTCGNIGPGLLHHMGQYLEEEACT